MFFRVPTSLKVNQNKDYVAISKTEKIRKT